MSTQTAMILMAATCASAGQDSWEMDRSVGWPGGCCHCVCSGLREAAKALCCGRLQLEDISKVFGRLTDRQDCLPRSAHAQPQGNNRPHDVPIL